MKLKKLFNEFKEKKGTEQKKESMTDKSQAQESNIYECIKKYGIQSLINQTQAQEMLYLDNTNRNLTLDEAMRQRNQLDEYFKLLPAKVRKRFGDSTEEFAEKFKRRDLENFIESGVISEEIMDSMLENDRQLIEMEKQNDKNGKDSISNEGIPTDINKGNNTIME